MNWLGSIFGFKKNIASVSEEVAPTKTNIVTDSAKELEDNLSQDDKESLAALRMLAKEFEKMLGRFNEIDNAERMNDVVYADVSEIKAILSKIRSIVTLKPIFNFADLDKYEEMFNQYEWYVQPLFVKENTENTFVAIVDTETTGLDTLDEPISVGVILIEVNHKGDLIREVDCYYGLREPKVQIDPKAQEVHGLTFESLIGKKFDMKVLHKIVDSADLLVAHNAKFDRRMLAHVMPRVIEAKWACSMHSLKEVWSDRTNGKWALDVICEAFSVKRPTPHNALDDCQALLAILAQRSGSTVRSKTLMGKLLRNPWAPPFDDRQR